MHSRFSTILMLVGFVLLPVSLVYAGLLLPESEKEKWELRNRDRGADEQWLMTYYVGYQNGYLKPKDVDYSLMTHIVVGGVGVRPDGSLNEHWHLSNGDGREMAEDVGKRADRANVKKLIWLGGPNEEEYFYEATKDETRATLVANILELVDELDYDGVDIDWEPIRAKDEVGILKLVQDLRAEDPDLLITVPVNWVPSSILYSKDLSLYRSLSKYADKIFIMSYSMAGPWPGWESWHGSALAGDSATTPSSIKTSVYAYQRAGVPDEKLGIGIGTYATCWEYPVRDVEQRLPSTFYPRDVHTMSMRTLKDDYYLRKYEEWDNTAKMPYLSFNRARGDLDCGFISYENERSIEEKVEYMKRKDLGGLIVWNIGTGYYPEKSRSNRHPLLEAAWEAFE